MGCSASSTNTPKDGAAGAVQAEKAKSGKAQTLIEYLASNPTEVDLSEKGRQEAGWPDFQPAKINTLPAELWSCTSLKELTISGHEFTEMPTEIYGLTSLEKLEFSDGTLNNIPADISKLTNLTSLQLYANQIAKLPAEIGDLAQLQDLNVFNNKIKQVPPSINKLVNLESLNMGDNTFMKFPEIPDLKKLENLQVQWGKVIMLLGDWSGLNLKKFMANRCKLVKLPELPPSLEELDICVNNIEALPASLAKCVNLTEFLANQNRLDSIPPEIFTDKLVTIKIGQNKFTSIPPEIGQCSNMKAVFVNQNEITHLPAEMTKLTSLTRIDVTNNPLDFENTVTNDTYMALQGIATKNKGKFFEV